MIEFLESLQFWHWLVLGFLLGIAEVMAPGAVFLWFGAAAIVVGVLVLIVPGMPWQLQLVLFAVLAFVAVWAWKRYKRARPETTDQPMLNLRGQQYVGQVFDLIEAIDNGAGRIKVGDTIWRVHGPDLPVGSRVKVVGTDASVLRVERVD